MASLLVTKLCSEEEAAIMPKRSDSLEVRKGEQVQLRGSTLKAHINHKGAWLDTARAPTKTCVYIILHDYDEGLIDIRVLKENCWRKEPVPTDYISAAFVQYPQLKVALDQFTLLLAKCRVSPNKHLWLKMKESLTNNQIKVDRRGHKEFWKVNFEGTEQVEQKSKSGSNPVNMSVKVGPQSKKSKSGSNPVNMNVNVEPQSNMSIASSLANSLDGAVNSLNGV